MKWDIKMSIKENYKNSKLGLIPIDWEVLNIGSVFDFLKTNSLSRSQLINDKLDEVSIFNIHYGDIHSSFNFELLDLSKQENLPKIIDNEVLKSTPNFLKDGDLIIADASEDYLGLCDCVELINIGELKLVSGLHTFALRDKSNNFADGFKSYLFKNQNVIKNIARIATGISVLGVTKSNLSKLLVPIPPLKEQEKIAKILSTWDEAIETTQSLIEKLQFRKKGLMQELLSGKKRLAGFSEEWEEFQFGDLLKDVKRPVDWNDEELYDLISVRRRSGGLFFRESLYGYKILTKNLKIAKTGDFLISKMQIVHGASGVVTNKFNGAKISSSYLALRAIDENKTDINYINWYSKTPYFYYQTLISSYGVHIEKMTFNFKLFLKSKIKMPSIQEQKRIVEILNIAQSEIIFHEDNLLQLKNQKKGLMQQLLTGKKRVKF